MADTARRKAQKENKINKNLPGSCDNIILKSVQQKLENQEAQCKMLQKALEQQKAQFNIILKSKQLIKYCQDYQIWISDTKVQHQTQLIELENMVTSSREMLRQQTVKFKDQVDKLVMSDTIIEQLIIDNDQLSKSLISIEQKKSGTKTLLWAILMIYLSFLD